MTPSQLKGESLDIAKALTRWFDSQGIRDEGALAAMAIVIGAVLSDVKDPQDLERGIEIVNTLIRQSVKAAS
jgi:hypothetical protein